MSFLSQCIFYFIKGVISFFSSDYLSFDMTNDFRFVLIFISIVMTIVGFIAIFKFSKKPVRYLDIPLIFLVTAVAIFSEIYVSRFLFLMTVPAMLSVIPAVFHIARCVSWAIDVKKKRRVPQKKNAFVVIAYVVASILLSSLVFVDFGAKTQKPTQEEIELAYDCYAYTTKYLTAIPDDEETLKQIEAVTRELTENGTFIKVFDDSLFHQKDAGAVIKETAKAKTVNRRKAYANVVALRLKTLIALKDYETYNEFFVDNCGYLFYKDLSFYFDSWVNDDFVLSTEDFEAIVSGYESAYKLCDNDSDRLFINSDVIQFYGEYAPDDTGVEKYEKIRAEIYDSNDYDELLADARGSAGYMSEELAIE